MSEAGGWVVRDFGPDRPGRYLRRDGGWGPLSDAAWFDTEAQAAEAARRTGRRCGARELVGRPDTGN